MSKIKNKKVVFLLEIDGPWGIKDTLGALGQKIARYAHAFRRGKRITPGTECTQRAIFDLTYGKMK